MNFQQLETLVWLYRLRNFHAVATRLSTTQPSISLRLQRLEEELGVSLIDRTQRGVVFTNKGRECRDYAEQIINLQAEMRASVSSDTMLRGRVSIGCSEIIADTWLAKMLLTVAERHPGVIVDTMVDVTPALMRGLNEGTYDVVFVGSYNFPATHQTIPLGRLQYRWMASPRSSFGTDALAPKDLRGHPIIIWPPQAAIHGRIMRWFAEDGPAPVHQITCNSMRTMARLVSEGVGIALLPELVFRRELKERSLVEMLVDPGFPDVNYHAVFSVGRSSLGEMMAKLASEFSTFHIEEN